MPSTALPSITQPAKARSATRTEAKRANLLAALVFVLGLCVGGATVVALERAWISEQQKKLTETTAAHAALVQQLVDRTLSVTYAMAAVLRRDPKDLAGLEQMADELLPL